LSSMLDVNAAKEKIRQSHNATSKFIGEGSGVGSGAGSKAGSMVGSAEQASVRASADSGTGGELGSKQCGWRRWFQLGYAYAAAGEKIAQPLAPFVRLNPKTRTFIKLRVGCANNARLYHENRRSPAAPQRCHYCDRRSDSALHPFF
jgi:class 3 adenylate cyclase